MSQLTFRTNQFNFTSNRRSETEVRDFLARDRARGLVVRVSDRFGEYGLVGVVLYEVGTDCYSVDTFLLSCRVLGKGVEHSIVAALAQRAEADRRPLVEFRYATTAKNAPAYEFLRSIAHLRQNPSSTSWVFAAEDLAHLEYRPHDAPAEYRSAVGNFAEEVIAPPTPTVRHEHLAARMQRLGSEFYDIRKVTKAIEKHRFLALDSEPTTLASGTTLESALVSIWRRVLARSRVAFTDNFFEVGGTSVKAVQLIAAIKKELKYDLSIIDLFECPTVTLLAEKCRAASGPTRETAASTEAARRGEQRRNRTVKRRISDAS
jgi:hypothetical protein